MQQAHQHARTYTYAYLHGVQIEAAQYLHDRVVVVHFLARLRQLDAALDEQRALLEVARLHNLRSHPERYLCVCECGVSIGNQSKMCIIIWLV